MAGQLLSSRIDFVAGYSGAVFLVRRHCDERQGRLSAWDRRRKRKVGLRLGSNWSACKEPQHRSVTEHANADVIYPAVTG